MCIAIYQPAGKELPKETLQNCWKVNDDGAGMLYAYHGVLYTHKELTSFEKFYEYYKKVYDLIGNEAPMALHFRIRTHGLVSLKNCHPFLVNEHLGFVHNGILSGLDTWKNTKTSDTFEMNAQVLQKMPADFLRWEGCVKLLEDFCKGSKLVFLDSQGHHKIINERLGDWHEGVWFSNGSWKGYKNYGKTNWNSNNGYYSSNNDYNSYRHNSSYNDWTAENSQWSKKTTQKTETDKCLMCQTNTLKEPEEKETGVCEACMERLDWQQANAETEYAQTSQVVG